MKNYVGYGRLATLWLFVTIVNSYFSSTASAIPAFARDKQMSCSTCHTAWPALNTFGHKFKENGYRFAPLLEGEQKISDDLSWGKNFPISTLINGRPYDKKSSGNAKTRAIREVELMVAGPLSKHLSAFFEIEAEDEDTNARGFDIGVPAAALTYTENTAVNIQLSWADLLWFDPYNTYTSAHRMTRGHKAILEQSFGGADNDKPLRTSRQNVTLFGRPINELFYGISFSGVADQSEGEEADTITTRLAYQLNQTMMIGGLAINGTCSSKIGLASCAVDRDYTRYAIDYELNDKNILLTAVYMQAKDSNSTGTADVENDAYYVEALYTFRNGVRAIWAPLLRYDAYENENGSESISELTFSVNYYFSENFRGMVEFWDRNGEGTTTDDDRLTIQVDAAF
ncbi:MAG: OprO/OprP family phosphate-selective porin [Gammaproteobacteria bacterium]|nr:OprO/OprP family phosphate-selective porin [Gammaproteobacteria bacterium]